MDACNTNSQDNEDGSNVTAQPQEMPGSDGIMEPTTVLDEATGKAKIAYRPVNPLSTAIGDSPIKKMDAMKPRATPPKAVTAQEQRVVRVLTTELWAVWALVRIKDQPANRQNQGAWFKFNPDGTYEYGFWDEPIGSGAWFFDGSTANLHLDSELQGDDREWRLQMGQDEDVMVWIGTDRFHTTDIQLKLERFANVPKTRAELGVTE